MLSKMIIKEIKETIHINSNHNFNFKISSYIFKISSWMYKISSCINKFMQDFFLKIPVSENLAY